MAEGYIKIYRKIWDNKLWFSEPFTRSQAWIDLILLANHKPATIFIRGHKIDLEIGELAYSIKSLAERWRWSQGKVERLLDVLKTERQIERQSMSSTTVISILMYKEYQVIGEANGTKRGNRRRTDGEQTETNNNVDNVNNVDGVFTDSQKTGFERFQKWISENAKNVSEMKEPFTIEQYLKISGQAKDEKGKIIAGYSPESVKDMLTRMHNHAELKKKNVSAYYTLKNWFRMDYYKNTK